VYISLMNTHKLDHNYFLSPKHALNNPPLSVKSTRPSTAAVASAEEKPKLSRLARVGFIDKGMAQPVRSRQIVDEWEPLEMKGTILEFMPQYNQFWNELKQKVFPLGALEQIIKDPSKYNHTKAVLEREARKVQKAEAIKKKLQRNFSTKNVDEFAETQKKVIGSKYRFIEF